MTLFEIRPLTHARRCSETHSANAFSSLGVSAPLMAGSVALRNRDRKEIFFTVTVLVTCRSEFVSTINRSLAVAARLKT